MKALLLVIVISFLAVILFIALKKIIQIIKKDNEEYYFKKMQELDKNISEKRQELDSILQNSIEKRESKEEIIKETSVLDNVLFKVMKTTDYEPKNALEIAKEIDDIFHIDEDEILSQFIKEANEDKDYKMLIGLQDKFNPEYIYKLKMLNQDCQIRSIKKDLNEDELNLFNAYIRGHKFKLNKFLLDLDNLIENNRPTIEVMTGRKDDNFDNLSPYIKTVYRKDIYKGIIVKFQDRIYDYSINERDV